MKLQIDRMEKTKRKRCEQYSLIDKKKKEETKTQERRITTRKSNPTTDMKNSDAYSMLYADGSNPIPQRERTVNKDIKVKSFSHTSPNNDGGVSICLSAWNTQDYIEECLDSIANQTWFKTHDNWEILLGIDACEKTLAKVKEIMHKYKNLSVYMMNENVGTYVTCNTIMKLAKYEWLLRFDTDDVMPNDMVEKIFKNNLKNIDTIVYEYHNFGDKNNNGGLANGSHLVKRNIWEKYGGYRNWKISGDYDFLYRIEKETQRLVLRNVYYKRRVHNKSLMNTEGFQMKSKLRTELNNFVVNESRNENVIECVTTKYDIIKQRPLLIVSFTTWKKRHNAAAKMLDIFKKQTLKPDKIYCYLSSDEYCGENIPQCLQRFVDEKYIEIKWVKENTFCHKRHEVFKIHHNDFVFVIDDDIVYPTNYLQQMYNAAKKHPTCAICYTGSRYEYKEKRYNSNITDNPSIKNSFLGGICCFPPLVFPIKDYFNNLDIRKEFAPKCDSSYIHVILIKNEIGVFELYDRKNQWFQTINGTQDVGVWQENKKIENNNINHMENIVRNLIREFNIIDKFNKIYPNFCVQ